MKLTDLFKFKLFERKDTADLAVVNENFQMAESEIDKRLLKTAVQNTNTVTEAGYALDARQANPNVKGSLAALIDALNKSFTKHKNSGDHDGRYYTETEINNLLAPKISASQYGAYFISLQGDYWNIVTENGVEFVTLVNGCCILTSNTTCDIHLDIMLRDNFGIYAGCSPHTHMFNMDSFKSALNMSKLTFDPNQTSVEVILSANTINAYDTKELLLAQNHYGGNENFSGLRFTQDGRVTRKYYNSDGNIVWGNIYVCQSAEELAAGTHSVMMHQGNIFRVDIYGAKYA